MSTAQSNAGVLGAAAGVGRNAAILAGATLFCKVGSLAVMPLILRAFPREQYGAYSVAFAYAGLLGMVAYFGMNPIVVRDIARGERRKGDVIFHCAALRTALLAVAAAVLIVVGIAERFTGQMWTLSWVAFAAMAFDAITGAIKAAMQAEWRFGRMATVDAVRKASQWVLAIAVVFAGAGISMLAGSVAIAAAVAMLAAVLMGTTREDFAGLTIAPAYALRMLKLAAPMGLSAALLLALERVDIWMLDIFRDKSEVGIYAAGVAFKPVFISQSVVWAILPLAFKLSKENPSALAATIRTTGRYLFVAGAGCGILFAAGGEVLVPLLAGPQYSGSVPVFRIVGLSLPFVFLSLLYLHALTAVDRQSIAALIFAGALIMNAAIDIVLVPGMGATGAILGTFVTEALITAVSFLCVWRFVGKPFEGADCRTLLAVGAGAAAAGLAHWVGLVDFGLTGVAVFAAMLVILKVVTRADLALFEAVLSGK